MFYQDIVVPESGYEHIQHSFNQIVSLVHSYNVSNETKIAVDFPEYSMEDIISVFGKKMRLFSSKKENFNHLNSNQIISMLSRFKIIQISEIQEVPSDIKKGRVIYRERIENRGNLKREISRVRNKISNKKIDIEKGKAIIANLKKKQIVKEFNLPYISLISKSNSNHYNISLLFKDCEFKNSNIDVVNSYGFSSKIDSFIIPTF